MKFPCPFGDDITDFLVVPLFPVKLSGAEKEIPSLKTPPCSPVPAIPALLIVSRNSIQKSDEGVISKYSETVTVPHQKGKSNNQQSINVNCSKDPARDPRPSSGMKLSVIPCPPGESHNLPSSLLSLPPLLPSSPPSCFPSFPLPFLPSFPLSFRRS